MSKQISLIILVFMLSKEFAHIFRNAKKIKAKGLINNTKERLHSYRKTIVFQTIETAIPITFLMSVNNLDISNIGKIIGFNTPNINVFSAVFFIICLLPQLVKASYLFKKDMPQVSEEVLSVIGNTKVEYVYFNIVNVFAAICEEINFRALLISSFYILTRSNILSILLSGVLFGAVHVTYKKEEIKSIVFDGIKLGLLYVSTGSIIPTIFIHWLSNFITNLVINRMKKQVI